MTPSRTSQQRRDYFSTVLAEDLLEQAWDDYADPFTNTVAVTIGRLRRKLGEPPVITTTPGVGYRIAATQA